MGVHHNPSGFAGDSRNGLRRELRSGAVGKVDELARSAPLVTATERGVPYGRAPDRVRRFYSAADAAHFDR